MTDTAKPTTDAMRAEFEAWLNSPHESGWGADRLTTWQKEFAWASWQAATRAAHEQQAAEIEALKADNASVLESLTKESTARCEAENRIPELERKFKEAWDDCGELNASNHELLRTASEQEKRIAALEAQLAKGVDPS